MRRTHWIAAALVSATAACASMRAVLPAPSPEDRLEAALELADAGDYASATSVLDSVYRTHWDREVGISALLDLAALTLDPRNPQRSLWRSADYSARLIGLPDAPHHLLPVARTLYLVSVELGALEEQRVAAEAARDTAEAIVARTLPRYTGQSVPAQLSALARERDQLLQRVAGLEQQLRDTTSELERVRRTLKP
jgi:hypothetical protein